MISCLLYTYNGLGLTDQFIKKKKIETVKSSNSHQFDPSSLQTRRTNPRIKSG